MERIRAYYEGDIENKLGSPTKYKTDENQNELFCSICGQKVFVNELIFKDVTKIIEKTSENPFLCESCIDEYEDLAHSH